MIPMNEQKSYSILEEESPKEPTFLQETGRHLARTGSRVLEQAAGLPGDILSLFNDYLIAPAVQKVIGGEQVPYEKTPLGKVLPPTAKHRESTEAVFGDIVKPQNKVESFIDNVTQTATTLINPMSKAKPIIEGSKAIGKALISKGIGESVKDFSANEIKGTIAELSSLFLLSYLDKPAAAKAVAEKYKQVESILPSLKPVDATALEKNLLLLGQKISKGTLAPSEKFIVDEINAIIPKIQKGKITPEELWAVKRSLNEKLTDVLFKSPTKMQEARARKLALGISSELDNTLKLTQKQNPQFYKNLKEADLAYGTIAKSNLISRFIKNNMKYNPMTHGLVNILEGAIGVKAASAVLPYEAGKIMYRIAKSPLLAKHYSKVMAAALAEDAITMNNELKKLDKSLQIDQKKDRFSLVND